MEQQKNVLDSTDKPVDFSSPEVNRSRRTFARSGLISSAILTFTSRAALGGGFGQHASVCSGHHSAHPSAHPVDYSNFPHGPSPHDWCDDADDTVNGCVRWKKVKLCPHKIEYKATQKYNCSQQYAVKFKNGIEVSRSPSSGITKTANSAGKTEERKLNGSVATSSLDISRCDSIKKNLKSTNYTTVHRRFPGNIIINSQQYDAVNDDKTIVEKTTPILDTIQPPRGKGEVTRYTTGRWTEIRKLEEAASEFTECTDILDGAPSGIKIYDTLKTGADDHTKHAILLLMNHMDGTLTDQDLTRDEIKNLYLCAHQGGTYNSPRCPEITLTQDDCKEFLKGCAHASYS